MNATVSSYFTIYANSALCMQSSKTLARAMLTCESIAEKNKLRKVVNTTSFISEHNQCAHLIFLFFQSRNAGTHALAGTQGFISDQFYSVDVTAADIKSREGAGRM